MSGLLFRCWTDCARNKNIHATDRPTDRPAGRFESPFANFLSAVSSFGTVLGSLRRQITTSAPVIKRVAANMTRVSFSEFQFFLRFFIAKKENIIFFSSLIFCYILSVYNFFVWFFTFIWFYSGFTQGSNGGRCTAQPRLVLGQVICVYVAARVLCARDSNPIRAAT